MDSLNKNERQSKEEQTAPLHAGELDLSNKEMALPNYFRTKDQIAETLNHGRRESLESEIEGYREQYQELNLKEVVQRFNVAFNSINSSLIDFESVVDQARLAFASGKNMLIIGETGQAKSVFCELVFDLFKDARTFSCALTKSTPEEALVGMIDPNLARDHGLLYHNTAKSMVTSHFAFLDEFPDANTYTQRALLTLFNERIFKKGAQIEPVALRNTIAVGNYFNEDKLVEAVHDRFAAVAYLNREPCAFRSMRIDRKYTDRKSKSLLSEADRLSMAELTYIQDVINPNVQTKETIVIPPYINFLKGIITTRFRKDVDSDKKNRKLLISQRRETWGNDFLAANALLAGRMEVSFEDLRALTSIFTIPGGPAKHDTAFNNIISKVLSEMNSTHKNNEQNVEYLTDVLDRIDAVVDSIGRGETFEMNLGQKLKSLFRLLDKRTVPFSDIDKDLQLKQLQHQTHKVVHDLHNYTVKRLEKVMSRLDPEILNQQVK